MITLYITVCGEGAEPLDVLVEFNGTADEAFSKIRELIPKPKGIWETHPSRIPERAIAGNLYRYVTGEKKVSKLSSYPYVYHRAEFFGPKEEMRKLIDDLGF